MCFVIHSVTHTQSDYDESLLVIVNIRIHSSCSFCNCIVFGKCESTGWTWVTHWWRRSWITNTYVVIRTYGRSRKMCTFADDAFFCVCCRTSFRAHRCQHIPGIHCPVSLHWKRIRRRLADQQNLRIHHRLPVDSHQPERWGWWNPHCSTEHHRNIWDKQLTNRVLCARQILKLHYQSSCNARGTRYARQDFTYNLWTVHFVPFTDQ